MKIDPNYLFSQIRKNNSASNKTLKHSPSEHDILFNTKQIITVIYLRSAIILDPLGNIEVLTIDEEQMIECYGTTDSNNTSKTDFIILGDSEVKYMKGQKTKA